MRPSRHLALSAAAGGGIWAASGQPWALPMTVAAGVLVDVDHAPDLWWTFALKRKPIATFLLHSWEWLTGLLVLGVWAGFPWCLVAVIVGYGLHVITDHAFNHGALWSYSLAYRAWHRFRMASLAPGWDFDYAFDVLRKEVPPAAMLIDWWNGRSARLVETQPGPGRRNAVRLTARDRPKGGEG